MQTEGRNAESFATDFSIESLMKCHMPGSKTVQAKQNEKLQLNCISFVVFAVAIVSLTLSFTV